MNKKTIYLKEDYKCEYGKVSKNEIGLVISENLSNSTINFINIPNPIVVPNNIIETINIQLTGDQYDKKICNMCNRLLPVDNFQLNQNGINNRKVRRPSCNECRRIIDGVNMSSSDKREWEQKKPNFEIWECPICHKKTIPGITSKVVLDHNHITGKPRAWICDSCNTGLGRFKDDTSILQNAINYLKSH